MGHQESESPPKPTKLTEEQRHLAYSPEVAMRHYKDAVYYQQRKGGDGWFHGRVSQAYRSNYDQIFLGETNE